MTRDVSRGWSGRQLGRDRLGRLTGSAPIVLSDIQVRAVMRAWRRGDSVEAIADMVSVSKNTLYAIVLRQIGCLRLRGRGKFLREPRAVPTEGEIRNAAAAIRSESRPRE
jgi:hypothetical protein